MLLVVYKTWQPKIISRRVVHIFIGLVIFRGISIRGQRVHVGRSVHICDAQHVHDRKSHSVGYWQPDHGLKFGKINKRCLVSLITLFLASFKSVVYTYCVVQVELSFKG